jgi:hypothetical protein
MDVYRFAHSDYTLLVWLKATPHLRKTAGRLRRDLAVGLRRA